MQNIKKFIKYSYPNCGNSPESFAKTAKASMHGFNEININCGCPSKNVIAGDFAYLYKNHNWLENALNLLKMKLKVL